MRIIARSTLRSFWSDHRYRDSEQPLKTWFALAQKTDWNGPQDIKAQFRHASFVGNDRVVFNIAGNKYRLVVRFNYAHRVAYIRFVGTHKQYDSIHVESI